MIQCRVFHALQAPKEIDVTTIYTEIIMGGLNMTLKICQ